MRGNGSRTNESRGVVLGASVKVKRGRAGAKGLTVEREGGVVGRAGARGAKFS